MPSQPPPKSSQTSPFCPSTASGGTTPSRETVCSGASTTWKGQTHVCRSCGCFTPSRHNMCGMTRLTRPTSPQGDPLMPALFSLGQRAHMLAVSSPPSPMGPNPLIRPNIFVCSFFAGSVCHCHSLHVLVVAVALSTPWATIDQHVLSQGFCADGEGLGYALKPERGSPQTHV